MRAVVMLGVGIVVGALGAVTAVGAMKQDVPYSRASMTLIRHHFNPLRKMVETGRCDAPEARRHLLGLQALSADFHGFLPTGGDDQAFLAHGERFQAAVAAALAADPATCAALDQANQSLGGACKACHDEFRG